MAEPALPRQMVRTRIRPHEAVPDLDVLGKFRSRQPVVGHAVRSADGRKADWTGSLRNSEDPMRLPVGYERVIGPPSITDEITAIGAVLDIDDCHNENAGAASHEPTVFKPKLVQTGIELERSCQGAPKAGHELSIPRSAVGLGIMDRQATTAIHVLGLESHLPANTSCFTQRPSIALDAFHVGPEVELNRFCDKALSTQDVQSYGSLLRIQSELTAEPCLIRIELLSHRSEERRVGKESRWRWSRSDCNRSRKR